MNETELTIYKREYNKQAYKTLKVYIPVEEYETIKTHCKKNGYKAMSGYVKALIDADITAGEEQNNELSNQEKVSIRGGA